VFFGPRTTLVPDSILGVAPTIAGRDVDRPKDLPPLDRNMLQQWQVREEVRPTPSQDWRHRDLQLKVRATREIYKFPYHLLVLSGSMHLIKSRGSHALSRAY
jgi:hypothetical protein